jgi:hypothetical protein
VAAAFPSVAVGSDIILPAPRPSDPITVRAGQANWWREGAYEVWVLRGACEIAQGEQRTRSREAVLWVDRAEPMSGKSSRILAYLEGDVVVERDRAGEPHQRTGRSSDSLRAADWLGRFYTSTEIVIDAPVTGFEPQIKPAIYERGRRAPEAELQTQIQSVQYTEDLPPPSGGFAPNGAGPPATQSMPWPANTPPGSLGLPPAGEVVPTPAPSGGPSARSVLIRSRSNIRMQARVFPSPDGSETIATITSGVNIIVDGIQGIEGVVDGKIDIETDRVVIWTAPFDAIDLSGQASGPKVQARDAPLEFYMEGNIVFREGDRVIYAERMYYNVRGRYGIVMNAEVLTPAPGYQGLIRLKADVLQQVDEFNFRAYDAAVTSSRIGVPRYWLQAGEVAFQDIQTPRTDPFTGQVAYDPVTGEPAVEHQYRTTSRNNFLYVGGVPVFYWPSMSTDLEKPSYYVNSLQVGNDNVFGFQAMVDWDVYQGLGFRDPPRGTDWTLSTDYLADRGFALGTNYRYNRQGFFAIPGRVRGEIDAWGLQDKGKDNLGRDRRAVTPTTENRGRIRWQHRHDLYSGFQFTGEFGWISDMNFLAQYYQDEWERNKDQTTGIELKRFEGNRSWAIRSDVRLNDFFTQTEWLPRFDHYLLGQPILDLFTWSAHSHFGYGRVQTATLPPPPAEEPVEAPLPWEVDAGGQYDLREGVRAATRHELGLPFSLGAFKLTPYVLGEVAYWGQDVNGEEASRLYGQAGLRGSIPFWSVNPDVRSTLFNVNGLAHKVSLDADFFWADADRGFEDLPLYDPLDDDVQEHFQRRFIEDLYGGTANLPDEYEARRYALRSGMQNWVTGSSVEIADDLVMGQVGLRQRWQTKRGAPGRERNIDWIVLDIEGSFFPEQERDNFGEVAGLLNYDFRWHVGDRFTLLSDGYADLFEGGLRSVSAGWMIRRPGRGQLYLGYRNVEGPFSADLINAAVNYRMSDKWLVKGNIQFDLGATGNIGESIALTRVGESLLICVGANVNHSRDSYGLTFAIEPRFLGRAVGNSARGAPIMGSGLNTVGGAPIPPAGMFGVE